MYTQTQNGRKFSRSKWRIIMPFVVGTILIATFTYIFVVQPDNRIAWHFRSGLEIGGCVIKPFTHCPNANLNGANLSDIDLHHADLTEAELSNVNFERGWLQNSKLARAKMSDANLADVNLSYSDLQGANLHNANLTNANLTYANLSNAVLTDTKLIGAILCNTIMQDGTINNSGCDASSTEEIQTINTPFLDMNRKLQYDLQVTQRILSVQDEDISDFWLLAPISNANGGSDTKSRVVLEDPGIIQVREGRDCAESLVSNTAIEYPQGPGRRPVDIVLEGSMQLPDYTDRATVFLNGWRLLYYDETMGCSSEAPCFAWDLNPPAIDRHFSRVKVTIVNVHQGTDTLNWEARGHLEDDDAGDPFALCYSYTTIAWNDVLLEARISQNDDLGSNIAWSFHPADASARAYITSSAPNPAQSLRTPEPFAAILPRGFLYRGMDDVLHDDPLDMHFLQLAYRLQQSGMPSATATWETLGILKDDGVEDFYFAEWVSILGGPNIDFLQPAIAIFPHEEIADICGPPAFRTVEYEIPDIPFDYAVPVLTAWNLWFPCGDEHVAEIGTWLHDIEYEKDPGNSFGTLRYKVTSVLRDEDQQPGYRAQNGVSILGIGLRNPMPVTHNLFFEDAINGYISLQPTHPGKILNGNNEPLIITDMEVGGTHQIEFGTYLLTHRGSVHYNLSQNNPIELLPGEELFVNGRFLPGLVTPVDFSPRTAWIDFHSPDPRWSTIRLDIVGNTTQSDADGQLFPPYISFGAVHLHASNHPSGFPRRIVAIFSTGSTPLCVESLRLEDESLGFNVLGILDAGPLTSNLSGPCGLYQVDPGTFLDILISFIPQTTERVETRLIADTNAGELELLLIGEGYGQ